MARVLSGTRRVRKVAWLTSELQASSRQQVLCEASVRLLHFELRKEISAAVLVLCEASVHLLHLELREEISAAV